VAHLNAAIEYVRGCNFDVLITKMVVRKYNVLDPLISKRMMIVFLLAVNLSYLIN